MDTAAAGAGGNGDVEVAFAGAGDAVEVFTVGNIGALARERSGAAIEYGGVGGVRGVFGPVPVPLDGFSQGTVML